MTGNPYLDPASDNGTPSLEPVRKGQKLLILGLLVIILANIASFINTRTATFDENGVMPPTNALIALGLVAAWLVGVVMGMTGLFRMSRGMGIHPALAVVLCVLILIPLVNIIVLAILNAKATARLRQHGYTVGLLGAEAKGN